MKSLNLAHPLFCICVLSLLAWGIVPDAAAQDRRQTQPAEAADVSQCLTCHNNPAVTSIRNTPHGHSAVPGSPFATQGCASCHGASQDHLRSMQSPGVVFGEGTSRFPASEVAAQNQTCLTCHQSRETAHWSGSAHQAADLACASCHTIHAPQRSALNTFGDTGICLSCHLEQRSQLNLRSHHPVAEGAMGCNDCHNPHGSDAPGLLSKASVNDTCAECHTEKRGPFLWEHQPVNEDCTTCHNPHGATQASLLAVREPFLCQSCHSETFHPSTLYSGTGVPPAGAGQSVLGTSCTNCHSTIHGSNHPSGARLTR
ncbi:MAG: hypothetical protein RLZZ385_928 [Pseudomonadota bacterium]|jgi:DmsE family decaheme c-type cytochrome